MKRQTRGYAKEFDEFVVQYNEWLASLKDPKVQRRNRWQAFLTGMGSVFDIFVNSFNNSTAGYGHPLYSRTDLTPGQKDAIALASDWQRVGRNLDNIISGNFVR